MRLRFIILVFITALSFFSCRKDFVFSPSTGQLEFSRDTVYLDTVFTNIGSSTYTLKVYNRSNTDISIPTIRLGKGLESRYRITVDGMTGENNRIFRDVELLARDSMFIFIETTANIAEADPDTFLYTDHIEFHNVVSAPQKVELVTLIQDAVFLYPQRFDDGSYETLPIGDSQVYGFYLDSNDPVNGNELIWTNEKPYVIYGYAAVPPNETLLVEAGARVHFHANSGLIAANNSSIKVMGTPSPNPDQPLENEVVFQGDRLEPFFANVPGQWGFVWLTQGSTGHEFNHLTIRNATVGLYITGHTDFNQPEPDAQLKNVRIYNASNMGVFSLTGYLSGENVVINNAGVATLACTYGGKYFFNHCTFNNNWQSSRQVAVLVSNIDERFSPTTQPLVQADFHNCIIYGSNQLAMLLDRSTQDDFNYYFNHCLIRFNNINNQYTDNPLYQFDTDPAHYNQCLIAVNTQSYPPDFRNVSANQLQIGTNSAAIEKADPVWSALVPLDIAGRPRPAPNATQADIGAYQNIEFEE